MASHVAYEPLPGSNGQPTAPIRHGNTSCARPDPGPLPCMRSCGTWSSRLPRLTPGRGRRLRRSGSGGPDLARGPDRPPHLYTDQEIFQVGELLRALHDATASFQPPPRATWQPWSLRSHAPDAIISHCDAGPWHVILQAGQPVGFIDWSLAGPTDRLEALAASGWWNVQFGFGDDLDEDDGAVDAAARRGLQLRLFLDGYGLPAAERPGLVTRMIEFAVRDCAALAELKQITPIPATRPASPEPSAAKACEHGRDHRPTPGEDGPTGGAMSDQSVLLDQVRRYFEYAGADVDRADELYHDDAVLEFPQSGERFEGVANFTEWRRRYPGQVRYRMRRVTLRDDLAVVELSIGYDDRPWQFGVQLLEFRGTKVARERIYIMEGWEAPAWRAPWRSDTPADPPE